MGDTLQAVAAGIRNDLVRGFGGSWRIEHEELRRPLHLDVSPDGISWLVRLCWGNRVLFDGPVDPASFLCHLDFLLRWAIRIAKSPASQPS